MEVKKFEAFSMRDALRAVKAEFGSDAVILRTAERNSKNTPSGKMIEITATAATSTRPVGASAQEGSNLGDSKLTDLRLNAIEDNLSALRSHVATRNQLEVVEGSLQELKTLLLENLRNKTGSVIKGLPPHLVTIERQLRTMGVDHSHIAHLIKHLQTTEQASNKLPPSDLEEHYRNLAISWMMKRIKIAPRWHRTEGTTSIHAFLGSSGVGKTSMVAKLASYYHLKEKAKIAVVSFDNHRIAAAEQLRVYTKVLGVPFIIINDLSELNDVLEDHQSAEIVLIDTAGRSPKSERYLLELEHLRSDTLPIENHLVLSVSEKESQLDRTVRYFAKLGINSLIFSKLDQSWSYGEIFNLTAKWNVPLSHFSIGPKVPDDIERASRERVIERIFGI